MNQYLFLYSSVIKQQLFQRTKRLVRKYPHTDIECAFHGCLLSFDPPRKKTKRVGEKLVKLQGSHTDGGILLLWTDGLYNPMGDESPSANGSAVSSSDARERILTQCRKIWGFLSVKKMTLHKRSWCWRGLIQDGDMLWFFSHYSPNQCILC